MQAILVGVFLLALVLYIGAGIPHIDPSNYATLFPRGVTALLLTAIAAYYSFTGFTIITEVAGEVRNARRNVPVAIIIAFLLVVAVYAGVTTVLTGTLDWKQAAESPAAVAESAQTFLPNAAAVFISFGALFASATTINAVLASLSRDVLRLGRDQVFPAWLGRVHPRFGSPYGGVLLLAGVSIIGVLLAFEIQRYALITVFAFLVIHLITATAVLRLPKIRPDLWQRSPFQFSPFWRWFTYVGIVSLSVLIIVFASYSEPATGLVFLVAAAIAVPYWVARRRVLLRRGVDLRESMRVFTRDMADELDLDCPEADRTDSPPHV